MRFTDITALAGIAFAIMVLARHLPLINRLKQISLFGVLMFIAALIPLDGLSVAEFVRGMLGDLSFSTLLLLAAAYGRVLSARLHRNEIRKAIDDSTPVLGAISLAALALYPFALGVGMYDPYRLGYGDMGFLGGLLLAALLAWVLRRPLITLIISLAVLGWSVGWYESNNLWDYLLDPWVAIYALGALIKQGVLFVRKKII
ncbi:MAG TPA: hypothetical protein DE312_13175 [Gallionella sp.]|jgi:hypothetical protein|nr:MAG: hypothetical protein A2Z87_08450 [Gallionellales bacterium GWA2_54_124]OGT17662.1 MAG: hypothetical protein A2522_04685 [Gallionellales bacterium RIFOXYD12_FULL_53_10]OGT23144.1 MAG: hypothetical protein A3K00_04710 [Gallionellales bacterium RIFOXYD2_FULL_52_7]HCI54247.1 hypothetical protein [Gallionella sp.]